MNVRYNVLLYCFVFANLRIYPSIATVAAAAADSSSYSPQISKHTHTQTRNIRTIITNNKIY